jgi:hypothetical protein
MSPAFPIAMVPSASTSVVAGHSSLDSGSLELLGCHLAGSIVASDFEAELLSLVQITQASAFDSRNVDEHVLTAIVRLDKAEAFSGIEPFNGAGGHENPPCGGLCRSQAACHASSERFRKGVIIDVALRAREKQKPSEQSR